jgi:hypothetical protein
MPNPSAELWKVSNAKLESEMLFRFERPINVSRAGPAVNRIRHEVGVTADVLSTITPSCPDPKMQWRCDARWGCIARSDEHGSGMPDPNDIRN